MRELTLKSLIGLLRSKDCDVISLPGCAYQVRFPGRKAIVMSLEDMKDAGTAYLKGLGVVK